MLKWDHSLLNVVKSLDGMLSCVVRVNSPSIGLNQTIGLNWFVVYPF